MRDDHIDPDEIMIEQKPRRLDGELAAVRRAHGLKIYACFLDEKDRSLREDYPAGSVLLSLDAQLDLTDMICTPLGGCDRLKDAQSEIKRLTGLLHEIGNPAHKATAAAAQHKRRVR